MGGDGSDPLEATVSIVTGGASGIGRATCLELARAGGQVVVVDVHQEAIEATTAALGEIASPTRFMGLRLDVRDEDDMGALAEQTINRFGRIDSLIAGAGILRKRGASPKLMGDMSVAEWDEIIDTNLKGVFLGIRAVLPAMIAQRAGHIITISSTRGRQGAAYDSAYCASKFGVIGLTESVAEEVRSHNIKVEVICPAAVDTPLWEQNHPVPAPPDMLAPERVADLIMYLLRLPNDAVLLSPTIVPFQGRRKRRPKGAAASLPGDTQAGDA